MTSKSEMKRIATLNPQKAVEELERLKGERDLYRNALQDIRAGKYLYYAQFEGDVETPSYFDFIDRLFAENKR